MNQLRFATVLAASGSFTAAADKCCVTQPALSNSIAQLEDELGSPLFVRTTRKVALTPFGAHLVPYIAEVLNAQSALLQQSRSFLTPSRGLIRIGTSPLLNSHLLGLMVEPFRHRHPDIEVVFREMNMTDLQRMLAEDLLDFIFGVANINKAAAKTTFLYEEQLLFIPPGGNRNNGAPVQSIQISDIADETYVMVPDACGLSRVTRALFRSHRRKLREYSGQAMSYQVLENWAALGIGAAILPKSKITAAANIACPIVDSKKRRVMIGFEATSSRNTSLSPHVLEFANHLRKIVPGIMKGLETT